MSGFDDFLDNVEEERSGKKKKKQTKDKGGSRSGSGVEKEVPEPYNATKDPEKGDVTYDPGKLEVDPVAEGMVEGEHPGVLSESGFDEGSDYRLDEYIRRQKRELREFHDSMITGIKGFMEQYDSNMNSFTLALEAVLLNYAQERTGIATVLHDNFSMSWAEAKGTANRIARETGEEETFNEIIEMLIDQMEG